MPEQINQGETFLNGQQVDGLRLTNHVKNAFLLKGAITEQVQIESPILASDDKFLVVDTSASTLRQVNASSLVQSNLPVIASLVTSSNYTAQPNQDVSIVANDGVAVTGKAFTSVNGTTVVITSVAHGLVANQIIFVTASVGVYSGKYKITSVATDTITYTLPVAVTPGSGTCNYTKIGTTFVDDLVISGDEYITGNVDVVGNVKINNKTPLLIEDSQYKTYVKTGNVGYSSFANGVEFPVYTSPALTIPTDETWTYQINISTNSGYVTQSTRPDTNAIRFRVYNNTTQIFEQFGSCSPYGAHTGNWMFTKALTSADNGFIFNAKILSVLTLDTPVYYRVVLNKIKTASLSDNASCI